MKHKLTALSIILLLTISSVSFMLIATPVSAAAGKGEYITKYTVSDASTGTTIYEKDFSKSSSAASFTVTNGASIKVTLTVKITISSPSSTLTMSTDMTKMTGKDHFWERQSGSIDISNPNSQSFTFAQNAGTFILVCYGKASNDQVTQKINNAVTLHNSVSFNLILIKDSGQTTLDSITPKLVDSTINDYNNQRSQKLAALASFSGADPGFIAMYQNVINQAKVLADAGLADKATSLLRSLDGISAPTASSMTVVIVLVIVFAVISVLFAMMYFRNRGKVGYIKMMVEDQIKDLEGVSMRAQRMDRNLAANLTSIKERLKNSIGGEEESEGYDQGGYRQ